MNEKISTIENFENNEYNLEYMINQKIENKEEFSYFEINDFLK